MGKVNIITMPKAKPSKRKVVEQNMDNRAIRKVNKWLKQLDKALINLPIEDRKDIIDTYSEKIGIEMSEGKRWDYVLENLELIETISKNIYNEFGINEKVKHTKEHGVIFGKTIGNIFLIPVLFFQIISMLIFAVVVIAAVVALIPSIVLLFVNYNFDTAIGMAVAIVGLLPIVAIGFSWLTVKTSKWFISSWNLMIYSIVKTNQLKKIQLELKRLPEKLF
ncbi:HAAS domain-containing protein [[Acholeplasma] multilocale]|uniref:HAAS domain-containing protein n=1 Tax=[Acholeplasma] multilocale TaxID=264638 RepID=UPI00047B4A2F|nr:DUF1700 domain-containing protein [[Acholeplasma] multilocale]